MPLRHWVMTTASLSLLALGAADGFAQPPAWVEERERSTLLDRRQIRTDREGRPAALTRVDFQYGYIESRAVATADPRIAVSEPHAITLALRAARLLAYEKLLEATSGVWLRSDSLLREEMVRKSALRARVVGTVNGARIVKEKYRFTPGGEVIAEVVVGLLIHGGGKKSLLAPVIQVAGATGPALPKFRPPAPVAPAPPGKSYTSLIVDASGKNARPALAPRIKTHPGKQEVYGSEGVDKEVFLTSGLVGYASSVKKARAQKGRVGPNPLVLQAVAADGVQRTDLLITPADATRLLQADLRGKFLRKCQVMFVLK
ncbi:MAG: hypothetical protein ACE5JJ_08030 [Nitrospinota bacterium]